MSTSKIEIDIDKLAAVLNADPNLKKAVCERLGFDRHTISKVLNHKRGIEGGELLTIADECEMDPRDLAR